MPSITSQIAQNTFQRIQFPICAFVSCTINVALYSFYCWALCAVIRCSVLFARKYCDSTEWRNDFDYTELSHTWPHTHWSHHHIASSDCGSRIFWLRISRPPIGQCFCTIVRILVLAMYIQLYTQYFQVLVALNCFQRDWKWLSQRVVGCWYVLIFVMLSLMLLMLSLMPSFYLAFTTNSKPKVIHCMFFAWFFFRLIHVYGAILLCFGFLSISSIIFLYKNFRCFVSGLFIKTSQSTIIVYEMSFAHKDNP